jgi:hypothetical protein
MNLLRNLSRMFDRAMNRAPQANVQAFEVAEEVDAAGPIGARHADARVLDLPEIENLRQQENDARAELERLTTELGDLSRMVARFKGDARGITARRDAKAWEVLVAEDKYVAILAAIAPYEEEERRANVNSRMERETLTALQRQPSLSQITPNEMWAEGPDQREFGDRTPGGGKKSKRKMKKRRTRR